MTFVLHFEKKIIRKKKEPFNSNLKMWFVISTPNYSNPDEEEVWECPTNWIKSNILSYPEAPKKGRLNLLFMVKNRLEPEDDWIITKKYKFILASDGRKEFCETRLIY